MNQPITNDKFIETLFKRLQELDKENKLLKTLLNHKQKQSQTQTETHTHPYFKTKELVIENQENEQICSLCNCELNANNSINSLRIYFCGTGNCSLVMEKIIDEVIHHFR